MAALPLAAVLAATNAGDRFDRQRRCVYRAAMARQNWAVRFPKLLRRRPRPVPDLWFPDEDDDEAARGGYLISGDPDAPPMSLT